MRLNQPCMLLSHVLNNHACFRHINLPDHQGGVLVGDGRAGLDQHVLHELQVRHEVTKFDKRRYVVI
jgi:hypothetical protein